VEPSREAAGPARLRAGRRLGNRPGMGRKGGSLVDTLSCHGRPMTNFGGTMDTIRDILLISLPGPIGRFFLEEQRAPVTRACGPRHSRDSRPVLEAESSLKLRPPAASPVSRNAVGRAAGLRLNGARRLPLERRSRRHARRRGAVEAPQPNRMPGRGRRRYRPRSARARRVGVWQ